MKTRILLIAVLALFAFSTQASNVTISTDTDWADIDGTGEELEDLTDGDTLFILDASLNIDVSTANDLHKHRSSDHCRWIQAEIRFEGSVNSSRILALGAGSTILLFDGGVVSARNNGSQGIYNNCSGRKLIFIGGTLAASCSGDDDFSASTTVQSEVTSFYSINSVGGLDANGNPVPVTWFDYDVKEISKNQVQLNWSTASEENNEHFEIEVSYDAFSWVTVDIVGSKAINGNSNEILDYSYIHNTEAQQAVIYYRIKQVDFNGDFSYTDIMVLKREESLPITIINRGEGIVQISDQSNDFSNKVVEVYSVTGALIQSVDMNSSATVIVETGKFYVFVVRGDRGVETFKQFIQ